VEYGITGITVENGYLDIEKNQIILNSENGIMITDGNAMIKNNKIANNTSTGVYIAGGSYVIVQNNVISSNGDGITLTLAVNSTSEININQNEIFLNTHSGLFCKSETYDNTYILYNKLSQNSYGFCVSSNTSTYITRNYILNNTIGIFYEEGKEHTAHFNDIWGNDLGMDVSLEATVNATHNYWGDRSGPYHESLNPRGKGNPVGGNGANLDFIFFLTAPIYSTNVQPTAILWTDKTLVAPNQCVTFIGTDSYDDGRVDQYFFDFGDGMKSDWTTLTLFNHSYSATGGYVASLSVIDDFNVGSDSALTTISVQDLPPLEASVTLSDYIVSYNEEVLVTVYVSIGIMAVENANVALFSVKGGSFTPQSGLTNATGYFTATFTAPNVTETTNVRIIARASRTDYTSNYADGSDHEYLKVLPPLIVQLTAEPKTVESEQTATLTVHVKNIFEEPVANASIVLSSDYGNLSATTGFTDLNGTATFNFTSPQTLVQINVTVLATARKIDYADGHGQTIITVEPKQLDIEVTADPFIIVSEATSKISAYVTCDSAPISNATVAVSSDVGGNFSTATDITDSNGNATLVFTAPQITTGDGLNATIAIMATKSGYVSAEGHVIIAIKPKVLVVQVTAEPNVTVSEAKINVAVHVTYDMEDVPETNVTIISETFPTTTGLTDLYGNAAFTFVAPEANTQLNITIVARAAKIGYADGEDTINMIVNPGVLSVEVSTNPSAVMSKESALVTVHVTCNASPVANASITISSTNGNLSQATGVTDSNGHCTFIFNAPKTTQEIPSVVITVNAAKNGYISAGNETTITVTPEAGGGWPLTTILLVLIPILVVVIVVVLIKLKIIVLSMEEEKQ